MNISNFVHTCSRLLWECLIAGAVASMSVYGFQHIYYRYVDTSHWMTYESVEPTKKVFRLGEPVSFQSVAVVRRAWTGNYPDALYCRPLHVGETTFRYITSAKTAVKRRSPMVYGHDTLPAGVPEGTKMIAGQWDWEGLLPTEQSECYLAPQPEIHFGLNAPRVVEVPKSSTFKLMY